MKLSCIKIILLLCFVSVALAKEPVIYSIDQDIPMGEENEILKKNFYINIGANQGVKKGTMLDVYRTLSRINPYDNGARINYKFKVGEIKVIHAEDEAAIAEFAKFSPPSKQTYVEIDHFMIGDFVSVHLQD